MVKTQESDLSEERVVEGQAMACSRGQPIPDAAQHVDPSHVPTAPTHAVLLSFRVSDPPQVFDAVK